MSIRRCAEGTATPSRSRRFVPFPARDVPTPRPVATDGNTALSRVLTDFGKWDLQRVRRFPDFSTNEARRDLIRRADGTQQTVQLGDSVGDLGDVRVGDEVILGLRAQPRAPPP
jgi:hypothetical protein